MIICPFKDLPRYIPVIPGLEEALGLNKEEPAETAEADADAEEDGKGFDLDIDIPGSVTVTADSSCRDCRIWYSPV